MHFWHIQSYMVWIFHLSILWDGLHCSDSTLTLTAMPTERLMKFLFGVLWGFSSLFRWAYAEICRLNKLTWPNSAWIWKPNVHARQTAKSTASVALILNVISSSGSAALPNYSIWRLPYLLCFCAVLLLLTLCFVVVVVVVVVVFGSFISDGR